MNIGLLIVIPMLIALLSGLVAHWLGSPNPGLYGGIALIIGVFAYVFIARNHKDNEQTKEP